MIRFLYVILIWLLLLGLLQGLFAYRPKPASLAVFEQTEAKGDYRLEVTTTFAVEPDPFALIIDSEEQPPALLVQLEGQDVLRITDRLTAGTPLIAEALSGLRDGSNEFFIKANPPIAQGGASHALRFKLYRDTVIVADRTFWSEPPNPLVTTVVIDLKTDPVKEDNHDH